MLTAGRSFGVVLVRRRVTELGASRILTPGSVVVKTRMAHLLLAARAARKEEDGPRLWGLVLDESGIEDYTSINENSDIRASAQYICVWLLHSLSALVKILRSSSFI